MKPSIVVIVVTLLAATAAVALAKDAPIDKSATATGAAAKGQFFKPEESTSTGSVTVEGNTVSYQAVAGTLIVHGKDWDDVAQAAADGDDDKPAADADKAKAAE